jgi:hypothetical protein
MTPSFRHGLLDPRPSSAAERHNALWLGPSTLGIEVTEPRLAAHCGLGNVDPQHRPDGGAVAAIEAGLVWPLPPANARLVTIRPDADAYGAMAVLGLRATGTTMPPPMHARIAQIARADRFDHGAWPGPRAMPSCAEEIDEFGSDVAGFGGLVSGLFVRTLAPEAGVAATREWITAGTLPDGWRERAEAAQASLFTAWRNGEVRLSAPKPGRIAVVEGFVAGALRFGYRLAPVVVAVGEASRSASLEWWRRITVAQWRVGHVDLTHAAALLAAVEPGWGGSPTIIGSPQGTPCRVDIARVIAVLRDCGA